MNEKHYRRTIRYPLAGFAAVCLAGILLSFIVPAIVSILPVFTDFTATSVAVTTSLNTGKRIVSALRFTITEALLSSCMAVVIGLPAGFLVARRRFPGRRFLLALSGVPLCIPPVVIALAFVLFYGRQGILNTFLMRLTGVPEPPVTFLYSLAGVVIAHGFYNFPVVLRTVSQVWERLPEEEEEAAVLLGAGRLRIFRTITLPRLSGAILASAVLVFLYCFFSFIIVMLFGGIGGTTLEVELYQAARSSMNFHMAGLIALTETVAALGIVVLYVYVQKILSSGTAGLETTRQRIPVQGAGESISVSLYLIGILIFFIGPLVSILIRSFTITGSGLYAKGFRFSISPWVTLFKRRSFFSAFGNTLLTGFLTAIVSTSGALFFALVQNSDFSPKRMHTKNRILRFVSHILPLAPLAVSSVILGFGWTLLVPRGTILVLVLAQSAMAWPFAWTQIRTALDRIPSNVEDAARLLSSDRTDICFRVRIPLALRGIFSGAALVFAISAGDASLPLVLSLGRYENLALRLYRLVGSYRFSEACACAVVLALLCGFVFFMQDFDTATVRQSESEQQQ